MQYPLKWLCTQSEYEQVGPDRIFHSHKQTNKQPLTFYLSVLLLNRSQDKKFHQCSFRNYFRLINKLLNVTILHLYKRDRVPSWQGLWSSRKGENREVVSTVLFQSPGWRMLAGGSTGGKKELLWRQMGGGNLFQM